MFMAAAPTTRSCGYEGAGTTDRRYLHADERGSVIAVSNASGAVIGINAYVEYGIPDANNIGQFGYTGQTWFPELGMNYYKARMYSPTLGRFMQTDPIGYGDGMNMYNYVGGDPINGVDPTGLQAGCTTRTGSRIQDCSVRNETRHAMENSLGRAVSDSELGAGIAYRMGKISQASLNGVVYGTPPDDDCPIGCIIVTAARHYSSRAIDAWFDLWIPEACCFTAGTLVSTPSGAKAIETLKVGDLVVSRDDATGETAVKPIVGITPAHERRIWTVTISYKGSDDRWRDEQYETTDDHPWRTTDGQWVPSASLTPGLELARESGTAVVAAVFDTGATKLTYNLEIADFHTYFVGEAGVWVHNACFDLHEVQDIEATLSRISKGIKDPHRNDGKVFENIGNPLSPRRRNYYREYVIRTPGVLGTGDRRLVIGSQGEVYYTDDHYDTFRRFGK